MNGPLGAYCSAGRMRGLYDAFEEGSLDHLLADLAAIEAEAMR